MTEETAAGKSAPAAGRSPAPARSDDVPPALPPWLPAAAVALGVLLIALTVRGAGGLNHGQADGPAHGFRPPLAILTAFAFVWVATSYARHRSDGAGLLHRAGSACAVLLAVAAIVVPLGLLMLGQRPPAGSPPAEPTPTATTTGPSQTPPITTPPAPQPTDNAQAHWLTALAGFLAAAIVAAIVVVVALVIINLLKRRVRLGLIPTAVFSELGDAEELADAVAAATEALDDAGDTREAVIACYAAMEERIRQAGMGRHTADTPEDVLKRATGAGLVPVEAGRRLTDLFHEARFSRHPMTDEHRAEARGALVEISAQIAAQVAARQQLAVRPGATAGMPG